MNLRRVYLLNGVNIVALTATQLAGIPVFLNHLGIADYERWVFISAIANMCLVCDLGLILYLSNGARMAYGLGDKGSAERFVSKGIGVIWMQFLLFTFISSTYYFMEPNTENLAFSILLFTVPISMFRSWLGHILTAQRSQIWELSLFIAFTVAYAASTLLTVLAGGGILALAVAHALATVIFGAIPAWLLLRRVAPDMQLRPQRIRTNEVRAYASGSLAQFSYSASSAVTVYLPVIVLGSIPQLPQGSIAVFTTARTLTGVVRQFCQQLARSSGIEMSRFSAPDQVEQMRRIFIFGSLSVTAVVAAGMGALIPIAELVIRLWTGSSDFYNPTITWLFCITAVVSAQMQLPMILPQVTNTASTMVPPLLAHMTLLLLIGLAGAHIFGSAGMVAALGIAEFSTLGIVALVRINPKLEIRPSHFLALFLVCSIVIFGLSMIVSAAGRWLIVPTSVYGLIIWAGFWILCIGPIALYLFTRRNHILLTLLRMSSSAP